MILMGPLFPLFVVQLMMVHLAATVWKFYTTTKVWVRQEIVLRLDSVYIHVYEHV